jgi:3D (Asp-Asp-Asp) domain-containing protein
VKHEGIVQAILAGLIAFSLAFTVKLLVSRPTLETLQGPSPAVMEVPLTCVVDEPATEAPTEAPTEPATEPATEAPTEPAVVSLGSFKVTHYCPCKKCCGKDPTHPAYGITASGTVATAGRTIAVDPDVIPYGTELLVRYEDGTERTYIAEDCGGGIDGNRLDVFMDSHQDALVAGVKTAEVFIYD